MSASRQKQFRRSIRHGVAFYLIVSIFTLLGASSRADDLIFWDFTINNVPVHFIFDSGADSSVLFRSTAERLGIKVIPAAPVALPPGSVHLDNTAPLILTLGGSSIKTTMYVVDAPPHLLQGIDGILSLDSIHSSVGSALLIDLDKHIFTSISLPADIGRWSKWKMVPNMHVLMFECGDGEKIGIDTGATGGVYLSPKKWETWRAQRNGQPANIDDYVSMDGKLYVSEEMRARKLTIGDFTLSDVPVRVGNSPTMARSYKGFDAIIGSYALYQMKVIIDRQNNTIYTLPNAGTPPPYDYNRLGAVFVPHDLVKSDDLMAHVVTGSPAYQAGIRDNDVLEKIDDLDVTKWKSDPTVLPLNRFWIEPAGTSLHLFLTRDGHPYDVQVTLKDLPPVD